MSRKSNLARDERRVARSRRVLASRKILKAVIKDPDISPEEKLKAQTKLERNRDDSAVRVTRRCQHGGRPRAITRRVGLCRMCFRMLAMFGFIPGIKKASW